MKRYIRSNTIANIYTDWSDNELIKEFYRTDDSADEAAIQSELEYRDYVYEDGKWHKAWHSSDNRIWHF